MSVKYIPEPFRIKMVEPLRMLSREERCNKIAEANYNLFYLHSEDCYIDLLTDSGTNAMSSSQWGGIMVGDESYAGASSYYKLIDACDDIFGYDYIQPVHQGRAAEKVLFPLFLSSGKVAISNMFFDTTRAHVNICGAKAIDCVVPIARDPAKRALFKGNMDVPRLESLIAEIGAEKIGLVVMTVTNNSAGGQPVSMQNLREVYEVCNRHGIPVDIDAARYAENAYFIKRDEAGYHDKPIKEIVREMFGYADMFSMSAKKDAIVNIGGLIGVRDMKREDGLILNIKGNCINNEGFYTYGGLAGRDLEAMSIGLYEGLEENYLAYRIGQIEYLASCLDEIGVAYQAPAGGHGVFLDASSMFPNIPYDQFPAQVLAIELYKEAGIRSCDIGSYMLGNDPDTGMQLHAEFEFTRLAIPRRVYTRSHLDIIVDAVAEVKKRSETIENGYKIIWEPAMLRHFQAHLKPIESDIRLV
jgi:tryptophanase